MMPRTHIDPIIPSDQDAVLAGRARHAIDAGENISVRELPPIIGLLLMDALKETEAGNALTLVSVETEVTTQQAADLLNVSRPFSSASSRTGRFRRAWSANIGAWLCAMCSPTRLINSPKPSKPLMRSSRSIRNSALYERNADHYGVSDANVLYPALLRDISCALLRGARFMRAGRLKCKTSGFPRSPVIVPTSPTS